MSKFPPKIDCFVCGRMKGATNHWYLALATVDEIYAFASPEATEQTRQPDRKRLSVTDFTEDGEGKPLCGNNCVQKAVERWLHTGSLEAPRKPAGDAA